MVDLFLFNRTHAKQHMYLFFEIMVTSRIVRNKARGGYGIYFVKIVVQWPKCRNM